MEIPRKCPFCKSDVKVDEDENGTFIRCSNPQCDMIVSFRAGEGNDERETNIRMFNSRVFDENRVVEVVHEAVAELNRLRTEVSSRLGGMRGLDANFNKVLDRLSTIKAFCESNEFSEIPKGK